jgi:hypothetical protein
VAKCADAGKAILVFSSLEQHRSEVIIITAGVAFRLYGMVIGDGIARDHGIAAFTAQSSSPCSGGKRKPSQRPGQRLIGAQAPSHHVVHSTEYCLPPSSARYLSAIGKQLPKTGTDRYTETRSRRRCGRIDRSSRRPTCKQASLASLRA